MRGIRNFFLKAHLYLSLGLAILLIPIALSGAPLVWRDQVDRLIDPSRFAVSGTEIKQLPSVYIARASAAAGPDQRVSEIKYPEQAGWPVRVTTRTIPGQTRTPGAMTVYMDPPSGNVLGMAGVSSTVVGVLHNFHHMLMVPQFSGRQIVGWVGVGLLFLSLSGIYLWWPRNNALRAGLRWRRSPWTTTNLHHLVGFWLSIPLAVVSLTGIYLAFPNAANSLMSSMTEVSAPMHRGYGAMPVQATNLDVDRVLALALAQAPVSQVISISRPVALRTDANAHRGHDQAQVWSVRLASPGQDEPVSVVVDDATAITRILPQMRSGDRAVAWINWIHEGRRGGFVWEALVFLTGLMPLLFLVTGVMMWLRNRNRSKQLPT